MLPFLSSMPGPNDFFARPLHRRRHALHGVRPEINRDNVLHLHAFFFRLKLERIGMSLDLTHF